MTNGIPWRISAYSIPGYIYDFEDVVHPFPVHAAIRDSANSAAMMMGSRPPDHGYRRGITGIGMVVLVLAPFLFFGIKVGANRHG